MKTLIAILCGVFVVAAILDSLNKFRDLRSVHFVLQVTAAALGIALAYWRTRTDITKAQTTFGKAVDDRLRQADSHVTALRGLDVKKFTSRMTMTGQELHQFRQNVTQIAGPRGDGHQPSTLVSDLSSMDAGSFGLYGGRIASRDPRLLVALYLQPTQEEKLKKTTLEAQAELARFQADEAAGTAVNEILGAPLGAIPTIVQDAPAKPTPSSSPGASKKTAQQYDVPPDSVLQPSYAVGKGLITQDEYNSLKNEYFTQCELSLGLILPIVLLAFALAYRVPPSWQIIGALVCLAPTAGALFLVAWDRWFKYRLELKLLILGRWDNAREAAAQSQQPKPKPDTAAIQKVVQHELSKLSVEVKPLVVELHREGGKTAEGAGAAAKPSAKGPGTP